MADPVVKLVWFQRTFNDDFSPGPSVGRIDVTKDNVTVSGLYTYHDPVVLEDGTDTTITEMMTDATPV